jgi:orotidine-5'-phosphate decarboxylase
MSERIILSADELGKEELLALVHAVGTRVFAVKIHDAYDAYGPSIVKELKDAGATRVWMDAKLYDIPNTIRARAKAYADNGIDIISVHASAGVEGMRAAREGAPNAILYAITVLTSFSEEDTQAVYHVPAVEAVRSLTHLAKAAEMNGVVCSAHEVSMLANDPALAEMEYVVPGIRSKGAGVQDQKRVATPADALAWGATRLVIGRQITKAADPVAALVEIEREISL